MRLSEIVGKKELENYVKAYLKKYKEIVEDNFPLIHDIKYVFFKYNNNPKEVYGIISKNHGTAVVIKYDSKGEIHWDIRTIDKPIEYYF
jgi:hypothetical protein